MLLGKFISIEGIEGAGKSTVVSYIKDYLAQKKIETLFTREPGGTEIAEEIRKVLLKKYQEPMAPHTELLLMFAGRAQHLQQVILPALRAGRWVVSDRFIDASYAYQGGGRGLDSHEINILDKLIIGAAYPDLTLLLDLEPQVGYERTKRRGGQQDRIEEEKSDFFSRVRESYLERAEQDPKRIKLIDASATIDEVHTQISHALNEFIGRH